MKKLNIIFLILIAFICCSGFSIPDAKNWKDYYEKHKSEINESLYCQYKPSGAKAGTINWISIDATKHSLMINFNEGQNLNSKLQIFSEDDTSPNAASNQVPGTNNTLFLYNYVLNEVCPTNIYLYYYDAYGDGSYYTINMVSSPSDLDNASDYQGPVTYTRGDPVKDDYNRAEDNITTDGNIQHPDGSVTMGDGSTLEEHFGDAGNVTIPDKGTIEGIDVCSENGVKLTLHVVGYILFAAKLLVPLLLIIFGSIDFGKALMDSDDKAIKDAAAKLIKRIIAGIIIFFLPTIFNFTFSLIDDAVDNQNSFEQCSKCLFTPFSGECSYTKIGQK